MYLVVHFDQSCNSSFCDYYYKILCLFIFLFEFSKLEQLKIYVYVCVQISFTVFFHKLNKLLKTNCILTRVTNYFFKTSTSFLLKTIFI